MIALALPRLRRWEGNIRSLTGIRASSVFRWGKAGLSSHYLIVELMKPLTRIIICLAVGIAGWACGNDDPEAQDTEAPVITVASPAMGSTFEAGSQIRFEAEIEDNVGLAICNVNIHSNFDGHSHARIAASPLSYEKSFTLTGKKASINELIDIPADATPGNYHFIVKAIDEARNATGYSDGSTKEIDITISAKN
jgi:hypothetical protein